MLSYGSARFATLKIDQSGHFSVNLEAQDGRWQNISCLDTDFVVFKDSQTLVYSLDGDLVFGMETATGELIGAELTNGESIISTESESLVSASIPQQTWWENNFYNLSIFESIKSRIFIAFKKIMSVWEMLSLVFTENRDSIDPSATQDLSEPAAEIEPEQQTEYDTEPESFPEADTQILNMEALVYNCRVLDLFGMSLEEIKAIIGNPDEEGWFAGDYYRWNNASSLIGNNENGIAQQSELFIAGSDIAMIRLDNFLTIREGSSFDDVRQLLGANLAVEDWSDTEWFDYVMIYRFREYEFIFNASNPAGPVSFIMARRN
jgi:hypothetical protein